MRNTKKEIEKHAVAGSREQMREYLKVFENELWIRYEEHEKEWKEAQRLGEARYRSTIKSQQKQLMDLMIRHGKVLAILSDEYFKSLTYRSTIKSSLKWSIELVVENKNRIVSGKSFDEVVDKAHNILKKNGTIDE